MAKYAKKTSVPVRNSKLHIEKLLTDWGIEHGGKLIGQKMIIKIKCFECEEELDGFWQPDNEIQVHACFHALEQKFRIIKTLEWMVADMTTRFDNEKSCFGNDSEGGYSDELTGAIELLKELKNETKGIRPEKE